MTAYLMFAFGFAAGTAVRYRDLPLAAIGLGIALCLALAGLVPPLP